MKLHHVLRQTGGGRVEVYAGFFFVDLDRTEYLAYYDRGFRELRFGRAEKENRKWTLTPMAPQEAPAVFRLLQDLETYGAVRTVQDLCRKHRLSDGFEQLAQKKQLQLSLEALVIKGAYGSLFTDEEANWCLQVLMEAGYFG